MPSGRAPIGLVVSPSAKTFVTSASLNPFSVASAYRCACDWPTLRSATATATAAEGRPRAYDPREERRSPRRSQTNLSPLKACDLRCRREGRRNLSGVGHAAAAEGAAAWLKSSIFNAIPLDPFYRLRTCADSLRPMRGCWRGSRCGRGRNGKPQSMTRRPWSQRSERG
jgi:hypothetical protein